MQAVHARRIRKKLALTQREMAELLGVHPMTVSKFERGVSLLDDHQTQLLETFEDAVDRGADTAGAKRVLESSGAAGAMFFLLNSALRQEAGDNRRPRKKRPRVPSVWADHEALNDALEHVPDRKLEYYRRQLELVTPGIIVELQVMGRLIRALGEDVDAWPLDPDVEALVRLSGIEFELDIKTLKSTQWEETRAALCVRAQKAIQEEFPEWVGHVRIADYEGQFPAVQTPTGRAIDSDDAFKRIMDEFRSHKDTRRTFADDPAPLDGGRLTDIVAEGNELLVYSATSSRRGDHELRSFRNKIRSALANKPAQFSGLRPSILVLVCMGNPSWPKYLTDEFGIADELFRRLDHLSVIVAIPYAQYLPKPGMIATRDSMEPPAVVVGGVDLEHLRKLFAMDTLGLNQEFVAQFGTAVEEYLRQQGIEEEVTDQHAEG